MNWIRALAVLSAFVELVAGQGGCAMERAEQVPAAQKMNGSIPCGSGLELVIEGVKVGNNQICPGNIVVTPTHDLSVPSTTRTYTEEVRHVSEWFIQFFCSQTRFLWLIPVSSSCESHQPLAIGAVPYMRTIGCAPIHEPIHEPIGR